MRILLLLVAVAFAGCETVECIRCENAGHIVHVCEDEIARPDIQMDAIDEAYTSLGYTCRRFEK